MLLGCKKEKDFQTLLQECNFIEGYKEHDKEESLYKRVVVEVEVMEGEEGGEGGEGGGEVFGVYVYTRDGGGGGGGILGVSWGGLACWERGMS